MTINLSKELENSIRAEVMSGHFASEDDMVAELVRAYLSQRNQGQAAEGQPVTGDQAGASQDLLANDLLFCLQNASLPHQDRRRLIIDAEAVDFEPQELKPLNALLRDFITRYRESNDREDRVAVNAAIRKCVATMSADDALMYAAHLLEAGPRASVPLEVESELVKMVLRKLTANPPRHPEYRPELADRLVEIASAYVNPRLLAREKYGAIALNAILALVLLRSRTSAGVLQLVSGLNVPWFQQLLARRSGRLREELRKRFAGEQPEELIAALGELEVRIQSSGT